MEELIKNRQVNETPEDMAAYAIELFRSLTEDKQKEVVRLCQQVAAKQEDEYGNSH